jgi:putative ABC transport system ATP-binding protein
MSSLATIRGLHKAYVMGDETVHALDGVDLSFDRGEYIAILGPSGSGKSTLMHILGFMDTPTKGSILFEGEEVSNLSPDRRAWYRSNRVGFVFQSFNLLPRLNVLENVALPLLYREDYTEDAREEAAKIALERVGMSHRLTHRPTQLSGGERQRVAIARAIVARPAIVFADEPTGNLDSDTGEQILQLLTHLTGAAGRALLMVTHSREVAASADRVVRIQAGHLVDDATGVQL